MARYIDADLFKENTNPVWFFATNGYCGLYDKKDIEDMIDEQPTADVQEIKHGHWVFVGKAEPAYDIFGKKTWADEIKCSECGFQTWSIEGHKYAEFCSRCGAKMQENYNALAETGFELNEGELHKFEKMLCEAFDDFQATYEEVE